MYKYLYIYICRYFCCSCYFVLNINFHLKVGAQQTRFFSPMIFTKIDVANSPIARWKLPNLETSWGWRWCDGPPGEWSDLWNARDSCVQKNNRGALHIITSLLEQFAQVCWKRPYLTSTSIIFPVEWMQNPCRCRKIIAQTHHWTDTSFV